MDRERNTGFVSDLHPLTSLWCKKACSDSYLPKVRMLYPIGTAEVTGQENHLSHICKKYCEITSSSKCQACVSFPSKGNATRGACSLGSAPESASWWPWYSIMLCMISYRTLFLPQKRRRQFVMGSISAVFPNCLPQTDCIVHYQLNIWIANCYFPGITSGFAFLFACVNKILYHLSFLSRFSSGVSHYLRSRSFLSQIISTTHMPNLNLSVLNETSVIILFFLIRKGKQEKLSFF